jgi:hypothetical protein
MTQRIDLSVIGVGERLAEGGVIFCRRQRTCHRMRIPQGLRDLACMQ